MFPLNHKNESDDRNMSEVADDCVEGDLFSKRFFSSSNGGSDKIDVAKPTYPQYQVDNKQERRDLGDGIEGITKKMIAMVTNDGCNELERSSQETRHEIFEQKAAFNHYGSDAVTPSVELYTRKVTKEWAKELYKIRHEEREAISYEIHGVASRAVSETPELIKSSLSAMEKDLQSQIESVHSIPEHRGLVEAHIRATTVLNSQYVTSDEFRLRFLRAEFFDVPMAVVRYCRCLNHIHKFFGDESLKRPIHISDLSECEQQFLRKGYCQPLITRDKMGRRVFVSQHTHVNEKSITLRERHRVELYLSHVVSEDVSTQRHGLVQVLFISLGDSEGTEPRRQSFEHWDAKERKTLKRFSRNLSDERDLYMAMMEATPIRLSAFHVCMPDQRIFHFFRAILLGIVPSTYRAVTRIHSGSQMENHYVLAQFGIPVEDVAPSKNKSFEKFVKARSAMDAFRKKEARKGKLDSYPLISCLRTDCPDLNCVVFGHRTTYNYPANVGFREYLRTMEFTTSAAPSGNKNKSMRLNADVLDRVINDLTASKSSNRGERFRFAIYEKDVGWFRYMTPFDDDNDRKELRKRISQTIRDDRKRIVRQSLQQNQSVSTSSDGNIREGREEFVLNFEPGKFSNIGIDAKRFKRKHHEHESNCCFL